MDKVVISKFNEVFIKVKASPSILMEMQDHFTFEVEGARYTPKFKMGIWDGRIRLMNVRNGTLYAGLFKDVVEFCDAREYLVELEDSPAFGLPGEVLNVQLDDLRLFIESLDLYAHNEKISVRDYQLNAIHSALSNKGQTILSPTASGKSLIIYIIIRYLLDQDMRVLLIVPTTQLVHQMKGDFEDYSTVNDFHVESNTHIIMGGYEKSNKKPITISTWQSLVKMGPEWFNVFDCVIVDECHKSKAQEIVKIMEKCTNVQYRLGFTGTLDNSKTNKMVIKGLFGPVTKVTTTKKLIEEGHLSDINITCVVLDYNKETKKLFKSKVDYQKEREFLVTHDKRNRFIRNLALSLEGNTLILFTLVEKHGEVLYDLIKEKSGDREVHFIHGKVDSEDRDAVRGIIEQSNNSIVVASMGTFSAGTNIRRLNNIIFASPSKSVIQVLQSIGRGLRKAKDKDSFNLYDIADRLNSSKTKSNHTYRHLVERLKIYTSESFDYKIIEVPLEG